VKWLMKQATALNFRISKSLLCWRFQIEFLENFLGHGTGKTIIGLTKTAGFR
jgi:hypothetical protein